jgi:response regulator of citrate/malate metabolism
MELVRKTSYDTIVLDYYMPDVNGIEFLKEVRQIGLDCRSSSIPRQRQGRCGY